jgi:hypothetical protein
MEHQETSDVLQEIDTLKDLVQRLKALRPEALKRVWFYLDDLVKQGL